MKVLSTFASSKLLLVLSILQVVATFDCLLTVVAMFAAMAQDRFANPSQVMIPGPVSSAAYSLCNSMFTQQTRTPKLPHWLTYPSSLFTIGSGLYLRFES